MKRLSLRVVFVSVLAAAIAVPAMALNVVNAASPGVACIWSTTCSATVTDYSSPLMGSGFFQSRINQGQAGSPAAGKWVYRYRVDLRQVAGITYLPYVDQVAISNMGPVRQYDYNYDSVATDHVFNVTSGGIGTKPVTAAYTFFGWTYFDFNSPVYAGSYPGGGESSYFYGFISDYAPVLRNISVHTDTGWVTVTGYAPNVP
ncbi:MAG TPA: hypothetical protein VJZ00_02765 [Thermoanaerobaculia bacterium]|nr:hypothetical protein [Thermoanaerobaculia bacterium]